MAPSLESGWQWLLSTLRTGGPGQCIFAITNACNAGCDFCSFALDRLPRTAWKSVEVEQARAAIDVLHRQFIRYLVLTGGEPLLHSGFDDIASYARARGMQVLLVTNGSRLTEPRCRELAASGVSSVQISIDSESADAHEQNRGLPGVCDKIGRATAALREEGIQVTASVTVSRLVDDLDALASLLERLGFDAVTFSYPLSELPSSFLGHARSPLVEFEAQELDRRLEQIKRLKRRFPVVNPTAALEEMQRFLRGEPQRFECLGGYRYFYLDWNLLVWRCHHWETPIGSIFDLDDSRYVRDGCTRCMVDCYRDSSVMQHVAVNASDALHDLRAGRPARAAARIARRSNLESVSAVIENRRWIGGL
ncbi:MAG: radical SAM protein [Thermodesulfobacteriota bacterium]